MNNRTASRFFAVMDLMLLHVCLFLLFCLVGVSSLNIIYGYGPYGQYIAQMYVSWMVFTAVYIYFFFVLLSADKQLLEITQKESSYKSAIKVCQWWLHVSWFSIYLEILMMAVFSIDNLLQEKPQLENTLKHIILLLNFLFVMQRAIGLFFVNNFKLEMQIVLPNIVDQPMMPLCSTISNQADLSIENILPRYDDLQQLNVEHPPPPYKDVVIPNSYI